MVFQRISGNWGELETADNTGRPLSDVNGVDRDGSGSGVRQALILIEWKAIVSRRKHAFPSGDVERERPKRGAPGVIRRMNTVRCVALLRRCS